MRQGDEMAAWLGRESAWDALRGAPPGGGLEALGSSLTQALAKRATERLKALM